MNNFKYKIIHVSDPHFGTEDQKIKNDLIAEINRQTPDIVIISGDLTQRALKKQFLQAKDMIDSILFPKIVIPGNHDIPAYNIFERFISPLRKFNKYISAERYPKFDAENISIIGVNTSTPFRSQRGKITDKDIAHLKSHFSKKPQANVKGVVIHHNAFPFEGLKGNSALTNTIKFIDEMNKCGVDLIFAGHLHRSIVHTFHEASVENNLLMLQAGTAISKRLRKEHNTFLIAVTEREKITINFMVYNGKNFENTNRKTFKRTTKGRCS